LYGLVGIIIECIYGEFNSIELFWISILGIPLFVSCFVAFFCIPYLNIKNSKRNRKIARIIKENGTKVKGTIKEMKRYGDNKNSLFKRAYFNTGRVDYEFAVVEYEYKGETKIVNTPYLVFNKNDLISKDVDV